MYEINMQSDVSLEASGDLSANQYLLHNIDASGQLELSGAGEAGYSLMDKPAAAGRVGHIRYVGVAPVKLGGTVAAGALVEADAAGKAVTQSAGVAVGRVLKGGDANEVVPMMVVPN